MCDSTEGKAMRVSKRFLQSAVLIVLFTIVGVLAGCQKKEEAKEEGKQQLATMDNLQAAYGAEAKRVIWYDKFARQAQKENLGDIAVLFRALSKSEQVHVGNIAKLLKSKGLEPVEPAIDSIPPGKAKQYLKLSASNESVEVSMEAGFVAKAEEEKFTEALDLFKKHQEADARHGRLLKRAIDQESNFARLPYLMCPECGYIVGSDKIEECPVCKTKKAEFQKI